MNLLHDLLSRLLEIPDRLIYSEIKDLDTWDGLLAQMDDPSRPKQTKKRLIEDWTRNRWNLLLDDVSTEAVESDGLLVVHRCIEVLDPKAFVDSLLADGGKSKKRRGLGVYWSYSFATAECYWGELAGVNIVLTGLADLDAIDIPGTVFANFNPDLGDQEKEIRLKKGASVFLTSVSLAEDDPRWKFDPAILLRA